MPRHTWALDGLVDGQLKRGVREGGGEGMMDASSFLSGPLIAGYCMDVLACVCMYVCMYVPSFRLVTGYKRHHGAGVPEPQANARVLFDSRPHLDLRLLAVLSSLIKLVSNSLAQQCAVDDVDDVGGESL